MNRDIRVLLWIAWWVLLLAVIVGLGVARQGVAGGGPIVDITGIPTATSTPASTSSTTSTTVTAARRSIGSTMYCEHGVMANGHVVHDGAVSSKVLPRGSVWRVVTGPHAGRVFVVEDTGAAAFFDMWTASCASARLYGARPILIEAA